jgi:hypothetical protein
VKFTEYDVSRDQTALRRMLSLSGRAAVPTIAACGEAMVGFDPGRLEQMLNCVKNRSDVI